MDARILALGKAGYGYTSDETTHTFDKDGRVVFSQSGERNIVLQKAFDMLLPPEERETVPPPPDKTDEINTPVTVTTKEKVSAAKELKADTSLAGNRYSKAAAAVEAGQPGNVVVEPEEN